MNGPNLSNTGLKHSSASHRPTTPHQVSSIKFTSESIAAPLLLPRWGFRIRCASISAIAIWARGAARARRRDERAVWLVCEAGDAIRVARAREEARSPSWAPVEAPASYSPPTGEYTEVTSSVVFQPPRSSLPSPIRPAAAFIDPRVS